VLRINDDQLKAARCFQHGKHRHPIDNGALHADMRHASSRNHPASRSSPARVVTN
jgi:hypothetical protein